MMMIRGLILLFAVTIAAGATEPGALIREAEQLSRANRKTEAMAKVEEAVAEMDRAHVAGESIGWQGMNGLRFAARLAREDFLDFKKAFAFCDKLFELADSDYWRVPARLERALTYRAMGRFDEAQREYDAIAAADERQRASALLPQAEMVFFDIGDRQKGRALLETALMNEAINDRERYGSLEKCAQRALSMGRRDEALEWYALLDKLPFQKTEERPRFLSRGWTEMGAILASLGRMDEAKASYRRAMQLENGEMRYRARARDALESIEYFE